MRLNEFEKMVYNGLMKCENLEDCKLIVKESIKALNELKDDESAKPYYLNTLSNLSSMLQMMSHSLSAEQFKNELTKMVEL